MFFPVTSFAFCDLGGMSGALATGDSCKKVVEYFNVLCILGNQVCCVLLWMTHISPTLSFTTDIPVEGFLAVLDIPGQISVKAVAFLT